MDSQWRVADEADSRPYVGRAKRPKPPLISPCTSPLTPARLRPRIGSKYSPSTPYKTPSTIPTGLLSTADDDDSTAPVVTAE